MAINVNEWGIAHCTSWVTHPPTSKRRDEEFLACHMRSGDGEMAHTDLPVKWLLKWCMCMLLLIA